MISTPVLVYVSKYYYRFSLMSSAILWLLFAEDLPCYFNPFGSVLQSLESDTTFAPNINPAVEFNKYSL